jgi:hypothetical protein
MSRIKITISILLLAMLVGMALIPAASAQEEDNYSVTAEEAFKHANTRMIALITTENDSEKWEGASIDPKPLELYDINGQKLYYEFSVYKENTLISRIDIGANKTLGSALRLIEINPKPYNMAEVMEKSIETAKKEYPTEEIVSTNMVVYDYPSVGAMTIVRDKATGVEHRIFVDAYTLEEVQDKPATENEPGVWSMYEHVSKDKIDENLKDWQKSEQFTKTLEQEVNNIGIDIGASITEENIKKLSNKINASSKVISSPYNSTVMQTTTDTSTQVLLDVPICGQEKQFYCVPATAQMISAWHCYSFTQDYIYQKMGGTNGDTTGIGPTAALSWYKLSRSEGGLGATRSYKTTTLSFTKAMSEIDYNRPFASSTSNHCRACAGYWVFYDSGDDCLLINDPGEGGRDYWEAVSDSPEGLRIYVIF